MKGPLDRDRGGEEKWRILVVLDTRGLSVPKCFLWYGIMWEAKGFVSTCVLCNRNKCPKHHVRAEMTKYHAGTLIERVQRGCILTTWDHYHSLGVK